MCLVPVKLAGSFNTWNILIKTILFAFLFIITYLTIAPKRRKGVVWLTVQGEVDCDRQDMVAEV